jgi:hypothetical protein
MPVPKAVTIPATVGGIQIVAANPSRIYLKWQNTSAVTVYIGHDNTVTIENGIEYKTGTEFEEKRIGLNDPTHYQGAYFGIVATGTADSRVDERDRARS